MTRFDMLSEQKVNLSTKVWGSKQPADYMYGPNLESQTSQAAKSFSIFESLLNLQRLARNVSA